MRVLLVGAGPVGCVTGFHLRRGGADVAFLVTERHADEAREGFRLRRLPRRRPAAAFAGFPVHTRAGSVDPRSVDAVVLCVGSPALRRGPWLGELLDRCPRALVVGLQPGVDDEAEVARLAGSHRTAWGLVSFVAYAAPLPGEAVDAPEIAYWWPPGARMPLSGGDARLDALIDAWTRGGLPARRVRHASAALASPPLNLHMAALERAGWSLRAVRSDRALLGLTARATREALAAVAASRGAAPPWWRRLPFGLLASVAARLAPRVLPFDVETYLRVHFTKVGDQTREQIERWAALADAHDLPRGALEELARALDGAGSPVAEDREAR